MIRIIAISLLYIVLFISSCGIIITNGQWEKIDEHTVTPGIKPSQLIEKYVDSSIMNNKKNYCITFFDVYCGFSYEQINYCNKLYKETQNNYEWIAITIYDTLADNKYRKKVNIANDQVYIYPTYYGINGLKSSLRNLYYNNNIPNEDIIPMTMIIINDTIKRITRGAINTELKYIDHRNYLDSLSNNY